MLSVYKQLITFSLVVRPVPSGSSPRIFIRKMEDAELYQIAGDKDDTIRRRNMLETEGRKSWKVELLVRQHEHEILLMSVLGIELE